MHKLRFRQIHLDFHNSPFIPDIGKKFDKKLWQERLQMAHADSITCCSCCHHGLSYHPTQVGRQHPGLNGFNLLRAQMDAAHEIGVNVPIYISAGASDHAAEMHPEWRTIVSDFPLAYLGGWTSSPLIPGFRTLCFNTPYLDYLADLIREAVRLFPEADGVFFDIVSQQPCCCKWCMKSMKELGFDPLKDEERVAHAKLVLQKYYERATEATRSLRSDMPVFHNSGDVPIGSREILPYFSHLELESLPTGGWGYDHYPMTAAYCRNLGLDFLGMTGKFHQAWGEFGGFKHPNALEYECAAMLANNSKCSIGDQLHPSGVLDLTMCRNVGAAYSKVEKKEPFCRDAISGATTTLLCAPPDSKSSFIGIPALGKARNANNGAGRFLLESHLPFDIVDDDMDFYGNLLIVANESPRPRATLEKINDFIRRGGKVVMTGSSIFAEGEEDHPVIEVEGKVGPMSEYCPDYILPPKCIASFIETPFLMHLSSRRFTTSPEKSLGDVYDPYFNRTYEHYSSHAAAPYKPEKSGFSAGVIGKSVLYFAHPVFSLYYLTGMVCLKEFMFNALKLFAADRLQVLTQNLPSGGRLTLMHQIEQRRYIAHFLYATTPLRGVPQETELPNYQHEAKPVEVIEELLPLYGVQAQVRIPKTVKSVRLQPENRVIPFQQKDDVVIFEIAQFTCHAMAVIEY